MNMTKSAVWGLGVIFMLVCGLVVVLLPAKAVPTGVESRALFTEGNYGVVSEPFKAVDSSRATAAFQSFQGSDKRVLEGKLWRPAETAQGSGYPFLVYSHGFMSFHDEGTYLARFLASHGYIVVLADFPSTNYFAPGGPYPGDVVNQPGDVRFIIDAVLKRNNDPDDSLFGQVDEQSIGALGLSLGGMTTELVTFDGRLRDERIRAAVSIAGPARMFTDTFFSYADVPFMMVAADIDAMVDYENNALLVKERDPDRVLVTLKGGSHTGFAGISAYIFKWLKNPDSVGCRSLRKNLAETTTPDKSFYADIEDEEYGVVAAQRTGRCAQDALPEAMRPAQQQMLTTLAVFSFFESLFNSDEQIRQQRREFLLTTLSEENSRVTVDAGDYDG